MLSKPAPLCHAMAMWTGQSAMGVAEGRARQRAFVGKLARRVFRLFGWRGYRAQVTLIDFFDWWSARSMPSPVRIGRQPWRLAEAFPEGTRPVVTIEPPEPSAINLPVFYGKAEMPRIGGEPIGTMRVQARRLHELPEAVVLPQHIVYDPRTQRVVPHPVLAGERFPHNGLRIYPDGTLSMTQRLRRQDAVAFDGPVFVADTSHQIYGHILLEVLPRLMLLEHCPAGTLVLTSLAMRPPYSRLFAAMGVDPASVVCLEAPAVCRTTYVADNFVDLRNFVSPIAWEAFARLRRLGGSSTIPAAERIYVSRRRVSRRPLRNEAEVEALFERYGFVVVHPQMLEIEDQIRLFSHARMIAGPGGSAMHNMVFAPDARVLILAAQGLVLPIDAMLSTKAGALGYVLGEAEDHKRLYLSPWSIDPGLVEDGLKRHFGL